jgi:hypothetical protein
VPGDFFSFAGNWTSSKRNTITLPPFHPPKSLTLQSPKIHWQVSQSLVVSPAKPCLSTARANRHLQNDVGQLALDPHTRHKLTHRPLTTSNSNSDLLAPGFIPLTGTSLQCSSLSVAQAAPLPQVNV